MQICSLCILLKNAGILFVKSTRYDHITDAGLLHLYYADKDTEWMGVLLQRYTLLLLGVCMKYLKNETEARDAVQQIFLKVLTEVAKYKVDHFKSWLYMVAKNYCLMQLRPGAARHLKEITENLPVISETPNQESSIPDEMTYDFLEEALKELSEEQRQCVILFYIKKWSYAQVSETTGFSAMQVKSYIQNGKRNLKIILQQKIKATYGQSHER